jgi:hypothetical protein
MGGARRRRNATDRAVEADLPSESESAPCARFVSRRFYARSTSTAEEAVIATRCQRSSLASSVHRTMVSSCASDTARQANAAGEGEGHEFMMLVLLLRSGRVLE